MNQNTKTHIANILIAIAGIGQELLAQSPAEAEPTNDAPKKRGRPAATPAAPATPDPEPPKPAEAPAPAAPAPTGGKTWEELKGVIEPAVKKGHGVEVKKIIAKHLPEEEKGGGLRALANHPEKQADFIKDIEALLF